MLAMSSLAVTGVRVSVGRTLTATGGTTSPHKTPAAERPARFLGNVPRRPWSGSALAPVALKSSGGPEAARPGAGGLPKASSAAQRGPCSGLSGVTHHAALGRSEPRSPGPGSRTRQPRVLTASWPRRHKRVELEPHVSDELGAGGSPADLEAGLCSPRRGGRRGRASVWETCGTMRLRFLLQGRGGLDLPPWAGCRVEAEFWAASRPGRGGWRQQGREG